MRQPPIRTLASASMLAALVSQLTVLAPANATEPLVAPPAPPATAPQAQPAAAQPQSPAEAARAKAEERRAAMDAEREKRYAELRSNAAQLGVELPATPPWKAAEARMPPRPAMPPMPAGPGRMSPEDRAAWHKQREERWKQMQTEAAARGAQLPERPSWDEIEQRRKAMAERFDAYRKTVEAMTEEQREAARAYFGRMQARPYPQMPRPEQGSGGGWRHPYCGDSGYGPPGPPMMPYYDDAPGLDQGPPPPPAPQSAE